MSPDVRALALALALAMAPVAASAQTVVVVPPGPVTVEEARDIAAMHGVDRVDSIEMNRWSRQWEVDGYDRANRYVEMDIDANTGAIVRLDR